MAITDTWTDPNALDLNTGQVLPETVWDGVVSNLMQLKLRQTVSWTNRTGGTVNTGDVVAVDPNNDQSFVATTTAEDQAVLGVVLGTIPALQAGDVVVAGTAQVRVNGATARGSYLAASATTLAAKPLAVPTQGTFAKAASASAGSGYVTAFVRPAAFLPVLANGSYLPARRADGSVTDVVGLDGNDTVRFPQGLGPLTRLLRVEGQTAPAAGAMAGVGVEVTSDGTTGQVESYNRTAGALAPLALLASSLAVNIGGTPVGTWTAAGLTAAPNLPVRLGQATLGSPASAISFTSIPGTYTNLRVVWRARSSGTTGSIGLRFNGDSGSNYNNFTGQFAGSVGIGNNTPASFGYMLRFLPGTSGAGTNQWGAGACDVPGYAAGGWKKAIGLGHADDTTDSTNNVLEINAATWKSTAAVTQVDVIEASGSNLVAGSSATLYGLP